MFFLFCFFLKKKKTTTKKQNKQKNKNNNNNKVNITGVKGLEDPMTENWISENALFPLVIILSLQTSLAQSWYSISLWF